MANAMYLASDLKRAVGAKRLGTYDALAGWTYSGTAIAKVEFARFDIVRYYGADGAHLATFQDKAGLDD